MGVHDTHSGAQPHHEPPQVLEATAPLFHAEDYEGPNADATDRDRAFWLNEAAKSSVALLFYHHRNEPHLLLDGTITVTREGDAMVARYTPNVQPA